MAFLTFWGNEFLVNTVTAGNQLDSSVSGLGNGDFVVSWTNGAGDGSQSAISMRHWNGDGRDLTGEVQVNLATEDAQQQSQVEWLGNGGYVIVWRDGAVGDNDGVTGQYFTGDGERLFTPFLAAAGVDFPIDQPAIAQMFDDGRWILAYESLNFTGPDTSGTGVEMVIVSPDGSISAPVQVNTIGQYYQENITVAGLTGGNFVVIWEDGSELGGDPRAGAIKGQMYTSGGVAFGGEFLVNTTTASSQSMPSVTALMGGGFVVSWDDNSLTAPDTSSGAVRAQVYTANGFPVGAEFLVNAETAGYQGQCSLAGLPDGRFVAVWVDGSLTGTDTSGTAIILQVFEANGSRLGPEYQVNATHPGAQYAPAVSALQDGRFVVTWTDASATGDDTTGTAIRGQVFDARTDGIRLRGTDGGDDYVGSRYRDKIKGGDGGDGLQGGGGRDLLDGGGGGDALLGGGGNDRLLGGSGSDSLRGGSGDDILFSGSGRDTVSGDGGADVFVSFTRREANKDQITDFRSGVDRFDFSRFMDGADFIGNDDFTGGGGAELRYTRNNGRLSGDLDGDGDADFFVTLLNAPDLVGADLIL